MLPERGTQCFRCLEKGHIRAECKSNVDRSDSCYRCGNSGHIARQCTNNARCPICESRGLAANHRLGGKACNIRPGRAKGRKERPVGKNSEESCGNGEKSTSKRKDVKEPGETAVRTGHNDGGDGRGVSGGDPATSYCGRNKNVCL